jgi:hypothetical protein
MLSAAFETLCSHDLEKRVEALLEVQEKMAGELGAEKVKNKELKNLMGFVHRLTGSSGEGDRV